MLLIFILFIGGGWFIGKLIASFIPDEPNQYEPPTIINNYTTENHLHIIYKEGELVKDDSLRKIGVSDFSTKPTNY